MRGRGGRTRQQVEPAPEGRADSYAAECAHGEKDAEREWTEVWFHVDGGFAVAAPEAPDDLRALSDADSVAVDPHKWLYAPLEAGRALVGDSEKLRAAFNAHHH